MLILILLPSSSSIEKFISDVKKIWNLENIQIDIPEWEKTYEYQRFRIQQNIEDLNKLIVIEFETRYHPNVLKHLAKIKKATSIPGKYKPLYK